MILNLQMKRASQRTGIAISIHGLIVVVLAAIVALSQDAPPGDEELRKSLLSRLSSGEEEQRMDAVTQLAGMFLTGNVEADFSAITALATAMRKDSSPVVRALAARALEVSGDPRAAEPLIAALGSEREVAVRKAIIYGLARFSSPQAAAALVALLPLLQDKKPEIRGAAAYALAEIRDPASAAPLLEFLRNRSKDEDAFGRSHAIRALGFIGDRSAIEPLLKALTKEKLPEVRREAARSLGQLASQQDGKVMEALREATLNADPYLSLAAEGAIAAINSRSR